MVERDEKLGLALLTELADAGGVPVSDLDDLLIELRKRLGSCPPEMGKNREASAIVSPLSGSKPMFGHEPQPEPCPEPPTPPGPGTGQGVHIGILDGPLCRHERFEGRLISAEKQFRAGAAPVAPRAGHATLVTSLVLDQA